MSKVKGQTSNWENNEINTTTTRQKFNLDYIQKDSLQHINNMSNSPTERGVKIMKRQFFFKWPMNINNQ